tara:strand:- start:1291 stop:1938 length:648 start_codon:yes stop_codon:yes gene_type:complete
MSYQSALLASDWADDVAEKNKDRNELGIASLLLGVGLPLLLSGGFTALGPAGAAGSVSTAQAGTLSGIDAILSGTGAVGAPGVANIGTLMADTGLHATLGQAGMGFAATPWTKLTSKIVKPFMKATAGLGPELGPAAARGLLTQVGSSLGTALYGKLSGISDKEYAFGDNPSAEFTNPFSLTNITKGLDTTSMWYEKALERRSMLDELAAYKRFV